MTTNDCIVFEGVKLSNANITVVKMTDTQMTWKPNSTDVNMISVFSAPCNILQEADDTQFK